MDKEGIAMVTGKGVVNLEMWQWSWRGGMRLEKCMGDKWIGLSSWFD